VRKDNIVVVGLERRDPKSQEGAVEVGVSKLSNDPSGALL